MSEHYVFANKRMFASTLGQVCLLGKFYPFQDKHGCMSGV